jgi:hypothetical protein
LRRRPAAGGASTRVGVVLSTSGAAGFASKGVIAKFLYADGWGADAVLTTRSFLASPIIGIWALRAAGPCTLLYPPPRTALGAAAAGALRRYLGALLDFRALTMIDAGVERVLLFSYPSMVVILDAAIYPECPDRRVPTALLITYAGIVMVVTGLDPGVLRGNRTGARLV